MNSAQNRPVILVVEDHFETVEFLNLALSDDYKVYFATNASEALEETDRHDIELFLIDIALRDEIDGVELVAMLRDTDDHSQTPMVAMTAHHLPESRQFYLDHGFDEYLSKPFFPDDLYATITRLLSNSKFSDHQPRA